MSEIEAGTILVAEPFMWDPNFKRSVLLLVEHHQYGSIGFTLNRPIDVKIMDLIADFPECDAPVYWGGPVQVDTLHYLHNLGHVLDDSVPVVDGLWWGGDYEQLKALVASKLVLPHNIRFYIGYSGWGEGQLEEEMADGSWVADKMDVNYLFKTPPNALWGTVLENKGDTFAIIAQIPEEGNFN